MLEEENENIKIQKYLLLVQPEYQNLISRFSKAYLLGSEYYVGDNILNWWNNYNVRYYTQKKNKLKHILQMILSNKKNAYL